MGTNCATGMPWLAWAAVALCWVTAIGYWVAAGVRGRQGAPPVARRAGRGWIVAALAFGVALVLIPRAAWLPLRICTVWGRWSGVGLLIGGTALGLWARGVLGSMWSSRPVRRSGHELRTGGPYALTRHPMYTGLLLMVGGTALVAGLGNWVPILIADVVAVVLKLRAEERLMLEEFGPAYREYQRQVPALVPRVGRRVVSSK